MKVGGSITGSINSTMAIINSKEGLIRVLLKMEKIEVINPDLLRSSSSIDIFKRHLKTDLFKQAF